MSSSNAQADVLTLGAVSQVPDFFGNNEPTIIDWGALQGAVNLFSAAEGVFGSAASSPVFQGLSSIRAEPTVLAQVVGRANDIADSFPPVWYVNLSAQMTDSARASLEERAQAMLDFNCWSSLKWWGNVFKMFPSTNLPGNKMMQSSLFVQIAMQDMKELSWLHSMGEPIKAGGNIRCSPGDLHHRIIDLATENFLQLDSHSREWLEPVLKGIVASASDATVEYRDMRMVVASKHEYKSATNSIVSSTRVICFAIGESFYDVKEGKNSSRREVSCDVYYVQSDAEFNLDEWKKFSAGLDPQLKKATEDFILRQSIDVKVPLKIPTG